MLERRAGCSAALLPDGRLLVAGGYDKRGIVEGLLSTCEVFDPALQRWSIDAAELSSHAGAMDVRPFVGSSLRWAAAALLPDGRLLVVGGYDKRGIMEGLLSTCEVFDPALQRWTADAAELSHPRWGHGCAALRGLIFAVGGCSLQPGAPPREAFMETLRSCEMYDPSSNKWSPGLDLNVARAGARVV
eukprot:CAMPEP_0172934860 /NCGR_PEP_ID=MMETSP1075-20121228/221227_1 /TAXON_ID=2916 /ORGANISM="Ceratium fusus, Strain PA161109" /LENGTH=187 /DNA_ID=CAMNT_0013796219 /DNA_START=425 /DNA_END=986 /DNA_ORIENTATION=+